MQSWTDGQKDRDTDIETDRKLETIVFHNSAACLTTFLARTVEISKELGHLNSEQTGH